MLQLATSRMQALDFLPDRILDQIDVDPDSTHLLWTGATTDLGYPRVWDGTRSTMLTRWVLTAIAGPAPSATHQAGHTCHDEQVDACPHVHTELDFHRLCVEPTHLAWQTPRENIMASPRAIARIKHERAIARPPVVRTPPPWMALSERDREINDMYHEMFKNP